MPNPTHKAIRAALSRGEPYAEGGPVEVRETHISVVFLTPTHAYKLLKPVKFDFLDFSTPEARRAECFNEVKWNARLAPDVYLGVAAVCRTDDGRIVLNGDGRKLDWVVRMRRLPDEATLQARVENGTASRDDLQRVLDVLVPFFERADRNAEIDAAGDPGALRRNLAENVEAVERHAEAGDVPADDVAALKSMQWQFLATQEDAFRHRVSEGWIRDGHGDLRAEHIYLTIPPVVVDCIAFNDRFRHADVLDEFCFLATDLERLGRGDLAGALLEMYRARMRDPAPDSLAAFFKSYRYGVRAKVACLRAEEEPPDERGGSYARAGELLRRAISVLRPFHRPCLIAFCGVSGSGKSTVARRLAARTGGVHLASDVLRKQLHGVAATDHSAAEGLYSRQASERTYCALIERGRHWLQRGASVLLDATFQRRSDREALRELAEAAGVPLLVVEMRLPADVAAERIRRRQQARTDVSDADREVLRRQLSSFEPPREFAASQRVTIEATDSADDACSQIVSRLPVV